MYQEALSRQLALDYCCSPADVADSKIIYNLCTAGGTPPFSGTDGLQVKNCCRSWEIISYRFRRNCGRMSETLC